jgi:predicted acetyltransferase
VPVSSQKGSEKQIESPSIKKAIIQPQKVELMQNSERLTFIRPTTKLQIAELWQNNFEGHEKYNHVHAHVPRQFQVPNEQSLNGFLPIQPNAWLIQRSAEQDIIGYIIQGNFGGLINNVGFLIGLPYVGKGYASEALNAMLNSLYMSGLKETYGQCLESNRASFRTMEKCGFDCVGPTGRVFGGVHELKFKKSW